MSKGKKHGNTRHLRKPQLAQMVIDYFSMHTGELIDVRNLFRSLGLNTHPAKLLCMDVLDDLVEQDFLVEREPLRYERTGQPTERERRQQEAEERRQQLMQKTFVGRMDVRKDFAFLLIDNREVGGDIFIPKNQLRGAKTGDKVTARIVDWPEGARNPVGRVVEVLGRAGDNETEMHAILAEFNLPYTYPQNVEEAANRISDQITPAELAGREDFRDILTFTIDPHDAKDFDDALSFRTLKNGLYEIGVHIADVSHYVTEGSIIDKEAMRRGTSVYLVDRTVPMLPERLCNYICSLRPNEDKLCYSVIFEMNDKAEVKRWHLAHTIIRSDRRFAYEEVQALFEAKGEASPEDYEKPRPTPASGLKEDVASQLLPSPTGEVGGEALEVALITLNRLAKLLREKRFQKGAVDFDRPEVRFDIDEKGKPLGTYIKVAKDANKLIEEFMLLANRTVAESVGRVPKGKKAKVLPYRVHEQPDQDKLSNLSQFVTKFGRKFKYTGTQAEISRNLNKLLHDVHGAKEQNLVEMVALRAMMKAKYSTVNIGHYGLAFDYYTHFTSPIRRYPDLMVHRLLSRYAEGGRSGNPEKYEALCELSSENEQTAALAERASIKYKQVEFMADKIGKAFDGIISGVTEFGIYVELNDNHCEGMIPLRELDDDYYEFDERNYQLWGKRRHRRFTLGDPIRVRVARANLDKKQLDFILDPEK
ncbi:MAG: RNB domain-containing ribonuclease [Bacteroidaceae bacterium]|nr:RNB domain-containing ribonuclease [Bacteroidaceae bacterium]